MNTVRKHNQGFSLIELLIAMMILSIVMVMVVQFMSTTSGAYQKNKKNLNIQSYSMQIMEQINDTLMQAKYVRIQAKDKGLYNISRSYVNTRPKRDLSVAAAAITGKLPDFVPDNYGNYAKLANFETTDRKVIIDYDNYTLLDEASGNAYPLSTDKDYNTNLNAVRSMRMLKPSNIYRYVKPEFIYVEYPTTITVSGSNVDKIEHVMYHFTGIVDDDDETCAIYMIRYKTDPASTDYGFSYAKSLMFSYLGAQADHNQENTNTDKFTEIVESDSVRDALRVQTPRGGLITDKLFDFYISADPDGNALLVDANFKDGGYEYNCVNTVACRNSNVLTERPQNLYKKKDSGTP